MFSMCPLISRESHGLGLIQIGHIFTFNQMRRMGVFQVGHCSHNVQSKITSVNFALSNEPPHQISSKSPGPARGAALWAKPRARPKGGRTRRVRQGRPNADILCAQKGGVCRYKNRKRFLFRRRFRVFLPSRRDGKVMEKNSLKNL